MSGIFDNSKCGMPFIPSIAGTRLITDCRVPDTPPAIIDPSTPTFSPISGALDTPRRTILAQLLAVDSTQTGNPYSWQRGIPTAGGGFSLVGEWGSNQPSSPNYDPAYAFDLSPGVPIGLIVVLVRGYLDNDWRFAARQDGVIPALTTGPITSGTYTSPTAVDVTLLVPSGGGPGLTTSSIAETAYNPYALGSSISAGKLVWLIRFGNYWYLLAADCAGGG